MVPELLTAESEIIVAAAIFFVTRLPFGKPFFEDCVTPSKNRSCSLAHARGAVRSSIYRYRL